MTREELKEHCEKQITACEMWAHSQGERLCGKIYQEHKLILELLEREPCEDCISKQALYESLYEHFHEDNPNNITEVTLGSVRNFVKNFPCVAPTHGTCRDCAMKRLDKDESEEVGAEKYFCLVVGNYVDETPDFYCAAFEKRNGEPQAATCTSCGSVFSYRAEDIQYGYVVGNGKYGYRKSVKCPYCHNATVVKEETEYTKEEGQ